MKKTAAAFILLMYSFWPVMAQKVTQSHNNKTTSTSMLITTSFKERLVDFLHQSFPESNAVPVSGMLETIHALLQKAVGYGFDNEADLATYVITAYVLDYRLRARRKF